MEQDDKNFECMRKTGFLLTSLGALVSILATFLHLEDSILSFTVGVALFLIGVVFLIKSITR